jgi:hypothetical protein
MLLAQGEIKDADFSWQNLYLVGSKILLTVNWLPRLLVLRVQLLRLLVLRVQLLRQQKQNQDLGQHLEGCWWGSPPFKKE